jgi:uncharacterized protein
MGVSLDPRRGLEPVEAGFFSGLFSIAELQRPVFFFSTGEISNQRTFNGDFIFYDQSFRSALASLFQLCLARLMEIKDLLLRDAPRGCRLSVKVVPRASQNKCVGIENGELKVKIQAPPIGGAANDALLDFLAEFMDWPRSSFRVVKGQKSRHKVVEIQELKTFQVSEKLKNNKGEHHG